MALDIVDIMLIFWTLVASGTFVLGNAYENYIKNQQKLQKKKDVSRPGEPQSGGSGFYSQPFQQINSQYNQNKSYANDFIDNNHRKSYNDYQQSFPATKPSASTTTPSYEYSQQRASTNHDSHSYYQQTSSAKEDQYKTNTATNSGINHDYHQTSGTITYRRGQTETDGSIPTATGFNNDCVDWINKILYLFYSSESNAKYVQIITESLCRSLNEKLSNLQCSQQSSFLLSGGDGNQSATNNAGCKTNFKLAFRDVVREACSRPELTNLRTETESDRSVSIICKIYNGCLVLDLTVTIVRDQLPSGSMNNNSNLNETSKASLYDGYDPLYHGQAYQDQQQHQTNNQLNETFLYELYMENLEGKLKSVAILQDKLVVVQFMERPDTKITLRPKYETDYQTTMKQQHGGAPKLNEDAIINLVMQTFTQVVVDLYFGDDLDFPRFLPGAAQKSHSNHLNGTLSRSGGQLMHPSSGLEANTTMNRKQMKQDFFSVLTNKHGSSGSSKQQLSAMGEQLQQREKKIFIKVNKAANINYNNNVYCRIEVDEPYQRFNTALRQGSEPVWDEHFIFNLSDRSHEMLFELWDGIPTMATNIPAANSKKNDRKNDKNNTLGRDKFLGMAIVSMEELQRNPVQKQLLELQSRPLESDNIAGQLYVEFLFMEHSSSRQVVSQYAKGDIVSVDRKVTPAGYVITTTTITKPATTNDDKHSQQQAGRLQLSPSDLEASSRPQSSLSNTTSELDSHYLVDDQSSIDMEINVPIYNNSNNQQQQQQQQSARRSRPAQRSNSILRAIKKRFSFSKTRSKSVEQRFGDASSRGATGTSSASVSRASSINSHTDRARSVPAFNRDQQVLPSIVIGGSGVNGNGRSSVDDGTSDYTYTHPSSQLVIECVDQSDGGLRHYLIPHNLANKKNKWPKKGIKIHLYNEHQFVASHLSSPANCHICGRVFSRRPGKQGYVCRNCQLVSHKQCHFKTDSLCQLSTRNTMILEYMPATSNRDKSSERKKSMTPDNSRQSTSSRRESKEV